MRTAALLVTAATILGASFASVPSSIAQTIEVGPGGVGVDIRSPRQRERDWERAEARRDRWRAERRYDDVTTGSVGCREVTIRERDEDGVMTTRRRRDCR